MASAPKLDPTAGSSVGGLAPHIEDLQAFFRSRDVQFGSAEDLQPFLERVDSDARFRDETASMLRTIIYRERDGLSRLELMELLTTAVGGPEVENAAAPEIRDEVRRLMAFVEGVFRTRLNPGGAVGGGGPTVISGAPNPAAQAVAAEPVHEAAPVHPTTDVFYRAQVAAHAGVAETLDEERRSSERVHLKDEQARPVGEELPEEPEQWHVPLEDFAPPEPERGPMVWLWVAGICALMLAFSAGLFVRQRLVVPLRDPNTPYEPMQPDPPEKASGLQLAPPAAGAGQATAADTRTGHGQHVVATDARISRGSNPRTTGAAPAKRVGAASSAAAAGGEANLQPRYMAPAVIGASPGLMASHLVYAPPPTYPMLAEMARIQGRVQVEAVVSRSGRVIRAQAISGHHLLRGAAVREVYARRYRPYTLNDRPADVATIVTVDFRLKRR